MNTSPDKPLIVLTTAPTEKEAAAIASVLIEKRLAACVSINGSIRSFFRWEDKISDEKEVLIIIKSRENLFENLVAEIKSLHSYELPEILALPVMTGEKNYIDWLFRETRR